MSNALQYGGKCLNEISDFANKQSLQSEMQFGFIEKLSTYLAVLKLTVSYH